MSSSTSTNTPVTDTTTTATTMAPSDVLLRGLRRLDIMCMAKTLREIDLVQKAREPHLAIIKVTTHNMPAEALVLMGDPQVHARLHQRVMTEQESKDSEAHRQAIFDLLIIKKAELVLEPLDEELRLLRRKLKATRKHAWHITLYLKMKESAQKKGEVFDVSFLDWHKMRYGSYGIVP